MKIYSVFLEGDRGSFDAYYGSYDSLDKANKYIKEKLDKNTPTIYNPYIVVESEINKEYEWS